MQAFIPSAGLGTRLRPLTNHRPKALVEIGGQTLLERAIRRVVAAGAHHIVINVHHMADLIVDFIEHRTWEADIRISDERNELLDTGGGLRHAAPLFLDNEPILIHNVDVLSAIDLTQLQEEHLRQGNLVTLAVSRRDSSRQLLFNTDGQLVGWHHRQNNSQLWSIHPVENTIPLAYSGIALVTSQFPQLLPVTPAAFPIIPEYLRLARSERIGAFTHDSRKWVDVGRIETLQQLEEQYRIHGDFFA